MKKLIIISFLLVTAIKGFTQVHLDQNGLKTTVIEALYANEAQPIQYEIATIGYNSHEWQPGGLIVVELFNQYFATGYEKYIIENGFTQGANVGVALVKLVESQGAYHNAKISLGNAYDLSTSLGGHINRALPIYLSVREYSGYKVKLTYLQDKVETLNSYNQIKVNTAPSGVAIADFTVPFLMDNNLSSTGNLTVTGNGTHYIQNGNVAIGTTDPKGYKLAVAGNMIAESVKVKLQGTWPDYVFTKEYQLPTLFEIEKHIKEKGHLPGIPSAAQVKTDGIDLEEMNAKLLQKIEELTLVLIAKDKKDKEMESMLNEQKELTKKLNERINILENYKK